MNGTIAISSDHAGYELKSIIIEHLEREGIGVIDLGSNNSEAVDYPDFAHKLAMFIKEGKCEKGISLCGSGNGINMTTNKHSGIRGALCWNEEISRLARAHNDANICSIPARFIDKQTAIKIVDIFLKTKFEGGRHVRRIDKIDI